MTTDQYRAHTAVQRFKNALESLEQEMKPLEPQMSLECRFELQQTGIIARSFFRMALADLLQADRDSWQKQAEIQEESLRKAQAVVEQLLSEQKRLQAEVDAYKAAEQDEDNPHSYPDATLHLQVAELQAAVVRLNEDINVMAMQKQLDDKQLAEQRVEIERLKRCEREEGGGYCYWRERTDRLREALRAMLDSAVPNAKEHPTMFKAWEQGRAALVQANAALGVKE